MSSHPARRRLVRSPLLSPWVAVGALALAYLLVHEATATSVTTTIGWSSKATEYKKWLKDECTVGAQTANCRPNKLRAWHRGTAFPGESTLGSAAEPVAPTADYDVALQTGSVSLTPTAVGGTFTYTVSHATGCVTRAHGHVADAPYLRAKDPNSATRAFHATPFAPVINYLISLNGLMGKTLGGDYDQGHIIAHSLGGDGHDVINYWPQESGCNQHGRWRRIENIAKSFAVVGGACKKAVHIDITFSDCPTSARMIDCEAHPLRCVSGYSDAVRQAGGTYTVTIPDACFKAYYDAEIKRGTQPSTAVRKSEDLTKDFFEVIYRGTHNLGAGTVEFRTSFLNQASDGGSGIYPMSIPLLAFSETWNATPLKPAGYANEQWTTTPTATNNPGRNPVISVRKKRTRAKKNRWTTKKKKKTSFLELALGTASKASLVSEYVFDVTSLHTVGELRAQLDCTDGMAMYAWQAGQSRQLGASDDVRRMYEIWPDMADTGDEPPADSDDYWLLCGMSSPSANPDEVLYADHPWMPETTGKDALTPNTIIKAPTRRPLSRLPRKTITPFKRTALAARPVPAIASRRVPGDLWLRLDKVLVSKCARSSKFDSRRMRLRMGRERRWVNVLRQIMVECQLAQMPRVTPNQPTSQKMDEELPLTTQVDEAFTIVAQ